MQKDKAGCGRRESSHSQRLLGSHPLPPLPAPVHQSCQSLSTGPAAQRAELRWEGQRPARLRRLRHHRERTWPRSSSSPTERKLQEMGTVRAPASVPAWHWGTASALLLRQPLQPLSLRWGQWEDTGVPRDGQPGCSLIWKGGSRARQPGDAERRQEPLPWQQTY